jgi:hypothetical protein
MAAGVVNANKATCDVRGTAHRLATQQGPRGANTGQQESAAVSHQRLA